MHLPNLRSYTRRTLLLLWLPSTFLALSLGALLVSGSNPSSSATPFQAGNVSGNLFAAAPPRGQVLGDSVIGNADTRTHLLEHYLTAQGSPLANHAGTFITVADRYDLDWRLLPALAGTESGFGQYIPKNSYNAWGWGIPTGAQSGMGFSSWDTGIETVGRGLRSSYLAKGYTTLLEIESRYTPPSAAQSNHPWVTSIQQFMSEIEHTK
jgi:hypothetical protein